MHLSRFFLRLANGLVSLVVGLALALSGVYSAYALWDNQQVYTQAENVQLEMLKLKPEIDPEADSGPTFDELLAINPDVRAWITMDGTKIDFPVLQGETNLTYINTDVYGNFALAGSIFLDSRNDAAFQDPYSLLYGHHMAESNMFGDLDLYKDQTFFHENQTGMLILPDGYYNLEIFACLLVDAGEDAIFDPTLWQTDINGLLSFAQNNSLHLREETIDQLRQMENPKVLALSTCSSEFTDARTIILAVMEPYQTADQEDQ